jgi:hypothetical protein
MFCFLLFFLFFICSLPSPLLLFVVLCHSTPLIATIWHGTSFVAFHKCCLVWCVTLALHSYYLLWCVIFHLALLLLVVVHCLCLSLSLLLVVVCHPLLCITIFEVFHLLFCINVACCGVLSLALCCYYLLWCVIPHFTLLLIVVCHPRLVLLLLFTMVCHPSPCPTTTCCGVSPSPYAIVDHCGLSFLALCCCFVTPSLFQVLISLCCCLMWFVTPHLVLLLMLVY